MKILIVEDDENKLNNLKDFINEYYLNEVNIDICHSFQSGLESILINKYDLLLLDMSLPNFDLDDTTVSMAFLNLKAIYRLKFLLEDVNLNKLI